MHRIVEPMLKILVISFTAAIALVDCFSMVPFLKEQLPEILVPGYTPIDPLEMTVCPDPNITEVPARTANFFEQEPMVTSESSLLAI